MQEKRTKRYDYFKNKFKMKIKNEMKKMKKMKTNQRQMKSKTELVTQMKSSLSKLKLSLGNEPKINTSPEYKKL